MVTAQVQDRATQRQISQHALDASLSRLEFAGTMASMHRSLALSTGDSVWARAFDRSVSKLVDEMNAGILLAPTADSRAGLARADSVNRLIIETERRAIQHALDGDIDAATALLESPDFGHLIGNYGDALLSYARTTDEMSRISNALIELNAIRTESASLLSIAGDPMAHQPRLDTYIGYLRSRLLGIEALIADAGGETALHSALDIYDTYVARIFESEGAAEAHIRFAASLDDVEDALRSSLIRAERRAMWRERLVAGLYMMLAVVLIIIWIAIVRLMRASLRERERMVERLQYSDARNAALLAAVTDMIFVLDRDGRYVDYFAPDGVRMHVTAGEFMGRTVFEIMPTNFLAIFEPAFRRAFETGRSSYIEYDIETDGERRWYEARLAPEGGERVLVVVRDISDRLAAEATIREGEKRFRSLVENSIVGTYIIREGAFAYVNPRFAEIFGRSQDELTCLLVADVLDPVDDVFHALTNRIDGSVDYVHCTIRGWHRSGDPLTVELYASAAEIDGQPAVIGTLLDVTERERTRAQMAALKAFYEETLNRLPVEVAVLDRSLRYLYLNPTAVPDAARRARLIGQSVERMGEIQGLDPEMIRRRQAWMSDVVESGTPGRIEEMVQRDDGTARHVLRVAAPVIEPDGHVQHLVIYALDISERKEYERKLLDAKDRAEEMARLKSAFLANMSHEIRTPLTGILGFASLLEEEVSDDQRQFASLILRSGRRLLDTLNAVLDLSRLEAGEMRIEARVIDICEETHEIVSFLRPLSTEKGLDLAVVSNDCPVKCLIDPSAYQIILNNLIGNAIKFTSRGAVTVRVGRLDSVAIIEVEDTGVGIDDGFLPQLFDEFKQESIGLTRSHEGAGLGLAITRRLVLMMKGTIEVTSSKGRGTLFTVRLPLAPEQLGLRLFEGNGADHSTVDDYALGKERHS